MTATVVHVVETLIAFVAVVGIRLLRRRFSILQAEHSRLCARLVTQAVCPSWPFTI